MTQAWWREQVGRSVIDVMELVGFRYPRFVYGGPLRRGEIPVFCLHDPEAETESFESQLEYLSRNGYITLSTDEYYAVLSGRKTAPARAVLLTFDDGYRSAWTMVVPLLKRYGMRATVFIIPGRVTGDPLVRPTLEDVWNGTLTQAALATQLKGSPTLMTWSEVKAAHESGVIDIQSHGLTHTRVFTAPQVVDFVRPRLLRRSTPFALLPVLRVDGEDQVNGVPPLGAPLYRSAPGLAVRRRYLESPEVRQACVDYVAAQGGPAFFARPAWRQELGRVEAQARRRAGTPVYEAPEHRREALRQDIVESKRQIERQLPGHPVRHFCYPWGYGIPELSSIAREAGYATAFWLKAHRCWRRMAGVGHDAHRIPRLQTLWIRSLPGTGRFSFSERLLFKARRRLTVAS